MPTPTLLFRRSFDAAALFRDHPPRFADPNKRAVFSALLAPSDTPRGTVEVSRWSGGSLPEAFTEHRARVMAMPGFFEYGHRAEPGSMHWHVNFAAEDAFRFYAGPLLAQDELQVLEHPVLAALREAANALGFSLFCEEDGDPTPVLVTGAERRGSLDTFPSPACPGGLYGNAFARAPTRDVLAALRRLEAPPLTNIVAIEAPSYGEGRYDHGTITRVLATAHAGFAAAVAETRRLAPAGAPARCVVHTGFWGTGAYGGDRDLMAILQLLAADLAGVHELVFYTGQGGGDAVFEAALERRNTFADGARVEAVTGRLFDVGYEWSVGNGT